MSKTHGMGAGLLVGGYDISGDVGAVQRIACPRSVLDVTDITQEAYERRLALKDGGIDFTAYFNPSSGRAHPVLSALPRSDAGVLYRHGSTLGNPAACMVGKQIGYDPNRTQDGALTIGVSTVSNGYGLEWGDLLTAGTRTDTGATSGTGVAFDVGNAFLSLPGSSGNYANTPDAAALDITGDLDIRVKIAPDDWTPAANQRLVAKYLSTGNQRSYLLSLLTTGAISLTWSADGTSTTLTETSSADLSALAGGAVKWVRATLDVDDGASDAVANFYTSDDGVTWTTLGVAQMVGATTSIFAGTATLELGSRDGGTDGLFAGKIYEAVVTDGIGGSEVAHPIMGLSGITDATGRVWTVNGTAFLSIDTRFGLQAYLQVVAFTGTDATVKLQHSRDNTNWSDVTGGGFTAITAAPGAQRIETSRTLVVERYLRVVTTTSAGFTHLQFVVAAVKNEGPVTF
ncbi:hypothetical protein RB614_37775 [Phytohabitans sp. ZYX-F-186]|uniref:F5/8 type C domain-containing protein n=1 Tax=Phytohabitans maris TaxID=3071409 RepID=A0ABU0ZT98_9ACTN|nr:hypothetical protein [Phytohabitans sp. ZYX-F-186]MDQ7910259.1 hypothetical protein [Phytohabitans sp. ZYX-F-186]